MFCGLQSGAKINISDASYAERIVSVTGSLSQTQKAFSMIANKFEEVCTHICFPSSFAPVNAYFLFMLYTPEDDKDLVHSAEIQ
jgi:hypothetical protein